MKYTLKAYSIKEQGPRPKQEDSMFPEHDTLKDNDRLFIVCDGMGGHSAGEVASGTVCQALSSYILDKCPDTEGKFDDEMFKSALNHAFDMLDTKDNGAAKKMGTTMTFLKLHDEGATIAHIGDSRVYHIRPGKDAADTEILFQTYDHSLVNDLVKIGELTPEEAKHSNQKNIITRAMQPNMERRPRADIYHTHDIKPGDYFMLCSDGILEQMEDENIKYIFSPRVKSPEDKVKMIIDVTAQNHDNHTAILVHITDVIDPIPVCPPVTAPTTEHVAEADAVPGFNDTLDMEDDNDDNKNSKDILNILTIALVCICLGGAVVYSVMSNNTKESAKSNTLAKTNTHQANTGATGNEAGKTQVGNVADEDSEGLKPFELDGKWGFKDKSGNVVVPRKYDWTCDFSEGLASVELDGKWGFIDKSGNEVIPFKYDWAYYFSEGLAFVELNGKYGFIDKSGNEVVPCKYDGAYSFSEGLALVKLDGKCGFIDKSSNEVVPCKYDWADSFSEGLASVKLDGKWGFIDKSGNVVISFKYDDARSFSEGLAPVNLDGKWGFIDKSGNVVIPCKYDDARSFSEGLAAVKLDGKWGFIDKSGNEVIPCKYEEIISSFYNGRAIVMENDKLKSIDKTGNEIIKEEENSQTPEIENMQEQEIAVQPNTNSVEKRIENGKDQQNEPVEPDRSDATTQVEDTNGSSQDTGNKTKQEVNKEDAQAESHSKES